MKTSFSAQKCSKVENLTTTVRIRIPYMPQKVWTSSGGLLEKVSCIKLRLQSTIPNSLCCVVLYPRNKQSPAPTLVPSVTSQ